MGLGFSHCIAVETEWQKTLEGSQNSSIQYAKLAIVDFGHKLLEQHGLQLKGKTERTFAQNDKLECHISTSLNEEGIQLYHGYMGISRWMIELGGKVSIFSWMPKS